MERGSRRYALRTGGERRAGDVGGGLQRVGLAGVLAHLDRTAVPCAVPGEAAGDGLAWEPRDDHDPVWWPQGVAAVRGDDVLLVSWYAKRRRLRSQGSRVTVVDRSDPERPRYGHVLLTVPRRPAGLARLGAVRVHAGGLAVLGDLLYVADTFAGVRLFRLDDAARVPRRALDARLPWPGAGTRTLGRRLTGGVTAYGYDHVLPQWMRLRMPRLAGFRWSFLSVGQVEGVLSLVVGEYRRSDAAPPRLLRYPLDPATGLPAFGADGECPPLEVHEHQPPRMQGVAVHDGTWYLSASTGPGRPGDLHVGAPGAFRRHRGVMPPSPEDLDWSRPGERLWCTSEWPGQRYVFPVDATRWPGP